VTIRILAETSPGEVRVAAVDGTTLLDYAIWRPGAPDGVGDVHRGRVVARVPAMAGAFVTIDGAEGFLPDSQGAAGATEGQAIGVRITRAAQGGKGPRLTALLEPTECALTGIGPPALLRRGPNAVLRLAALHANAPVYVDAPGLAASLRRVLGERVAVESDCWDERVAEQAAELAENSAALPGGARATFHPTPALVAIDIDAGAATAGRTAKAASQRALNQNMLPALMRQIRLRNLSGAILLDLAGMPVRKRFALGPALAAALASDPLQPRFLGFTALGLAEIVRPRIHPPLHELLVGPQAAGLAALRAVVAAAGLPEQHPTLRASPSVASALQQDEAALAALAERIGRPTSIIVDPSLPPSGWSVVHDRTR
jgi:Ribonuclease G/E